MRTSLTRRLLGGVLVVLLLTAAGCSSPSKTATPASAATTASTATTAKTGTIVINPQFNSADSFSDGLARVRIGDFTTGKWGFIDKTGHYVINPQFNGATSFSDGLAQVSIGGKWGYIAR